MKKTHKDLDFAVDDASNNQRVFKKFDDACGLAVALAASDGAEHNVDVLAWSVTAARIWGGDEAVDSYREDPEASVLERIAIRAESKGRVA